MGKTSTNEIRIFVANLGAYNAGRLIGEWIDLPMDEETLQDRIGDILNHRDESDELYGEEVAIHDYEAPFTIGEYDSVLGVNETAERIAALSEDDAAVIEAVLGNFHDADEGLAKLESGEYTIYSGCDDMSDVAYEVAESSGDITTLDASKINGVGYAAYIDWECVGRDMEINGTFVSYDGGYVEIHD